MMLTIFDDIYFMNKALEQAKEAMEKEEVPVGAIIVANNQIIAKGHNLTEQLNDVTAHAEMQCITSAANFLGGKYLKKCTLYVTLEPCIMCAGALNWSQIDKIVFGAYDPKRGALQLDTIFHPSTEIIGGILEQECGDLLTSFFQKRR